MRRDRLPIDDMDNADRMLGIVIIGLGVGCGIWTLLKFCAWVLS